MSTRNLIVVGVAALMAGALLGSALVSAFAWSSQQDGANRLVAVGDVMVAGTLLLSAVAVVLSLAAYMDSTETPELRPEIVFRCSEPNLPVFLAETPSRDGTRRLVPFRQLEAWVSIHNQTSALAHNPAVRIDLIGLGGLRAQPEWRPVARTNRIGVHAVQWDGGAHLAIHGHGTRVLPLLTFADVVGLQDAALPRLRVTLLADGFRRIYTLPVELKADDEYRAYCLDRAQRHPQGQSLTESCDADACERRAAMRLLLLTDDGQPTEVTACTSHREQLLSRPGPASFGRGAAARPPAVALPIVDNLDHGHGAQTSDEALVEA